MYLGMDVTTTARQEVPLVKIAHIDGFYMSCPYQTISNRPIPRLGGNAAAANPTEFPHQVSIQIHHSHTCGGTLIGVKHVLTAAHCVSDLKAHGTANLLYVEVGAISLKEGQRIKVAGYKVHDQYQGSSISGSAIFAHDIAILQLAIPVTISNRVNIINLPKEGEEIPVGAHTTVSGFGSTRIGGPNSDVLRKASMRIVSFSYCQSHWPQNRLLPSQICASYEIDQGTCAGDSGGPMIYAGKIVGIVSCGSSVCQNGVPDLYTKVSYYIPFIKECMAKDLSQGSSTLGTGNLQMESAPSYPSVLQPPHPSQITHPSFGQAPAITGQIPSNGVQVPAGHVPTYPVQVPSHLGLPSLVQTLYMPLSPPGVSFDPVHPANSIPTQPISSLTMHDPNNAVVVPTFPVHSASSIATQPISSLTMHGPNTVVVPTFPIHSASSIPNPPSNLIINSPTAIQPQNIHYLVPTYHR
ncbi:hypothetical protein QAD02_004300 [Eretmocerus hayati]|uniref:Uncharacterized protein n=1 Tax=Eretmocerus hayati TaxID=131215 RepID=A0ACC2NRV0_9HYME|nr:hypothetical protein QAD02_004300 [Eretmocerus hayati]